MRTGTIKKSTTKKFLLLMIILVLFRISYYSMAFYRCKVLLAEQYASEQNYNYLVKIIGVEATQYNSYLLEFIILGTDNPLGFQCHNLKGTLFLKENEYERLLKANLLDSILLHKVHINGRIKPIDSPSNPGQINPLIVQLGQKSVGSFISKDAIKKHDSWFSKTLIFKAFITLEQNKYLTMLVLEKKIDCLYSQPANGIVKAMILGVKDDIDINVSDLYKEQGISHIIAISGLHIGMLFMLIDTFLRILINSLRLKLLLCSAAIVAYNILIGFNTSAIRASCMVLILFFAITFNRAYDRIKCLLFTALLFLFLFPESLFKCGFLLSYGAVVGLFTVYPIIKERLNIHYKNYLQSSLSDMLLVSFSVNIMTIPILIYFFGGISVTMLAANILVVPTVILVYLGSLASIAVSFPTLVLGRFIAGSVTITSAYIEGVCTVLSKVPYNYILTRRPTILEISLYYLIVIMVLLFFNEKNKINKGESKNDHINKTARLPIKKNT